MFSNDSLTPLERAELRAAVSEAHSLRGVGRAPVVPQQPGKAEWDLLELPAGLKPPFPQAKPYIRLQPFFPYLLQRHD